MADEVIGFVQGLLLEVTGAVCILRDNEDVVLRNKTWSPLQGPSKKGLAQGMGTEPGGRNRQWCNTVRLTKTRAGQFCLADSEGTASQVS